MDPSTLKDYHKQLKDNVKSVCEHFTHILNTRTEHLNFDVSVKAAELLRSYENLLQLVAEIRTNLIINDNQVEEVDVKDAKLIKLRDEMSTFLYELEIHKDSSRS